MGAIGRPQDSPPGCSGGHSGDHHMGGWPLVWRPRLGYCDRICPHGLGHPDPDDVVRGQGLGEVCTAHGCDGCCIAPLREGGDERGRRGGE
jgi:hypothetical protein